MKRNQNYILTFALFCILLIGCKQNKEIEMQKIVDLYVDILIVDEVQRENIDSLKFHKQLAYEKHGISKEEFEKTFESYKIDESKWDTFFDMSVERVDSVEAQRKRANNK